MKNDYSEKMIPSYECDPDIQKAVPDFDEIEEVPDCYEAWIQGAQWERNRAKKLNNERNEEVIP